MASNDPSERAMIARLGAYTRWSKAEDRAAATQAARDARDEQFVRQVDPDGKLPPDERARRVEMARRAHFTRLALRSAQARRARRLADRIEAELARELGDVVA